MAREDQCRKTMKTVGKALVMRLLIALLLVWILFQTHMELWVMGLMVLVSLLNLGGLFPLWTEWKVRRRELQEIIDQYE